MNPELQNAIAELAQKLGTTADKLFPLLVARERLDALLAISLGAIGWAICAGVACWAYIKRHEWDEDVMFPVIVISGLVCFLFIVMTLANVPNFIYPEAAAVKSLLE